jgi:hypothetical protein
VPNSDKQSEQTCFFTDDDEQEELAAIPSKRCDVDFVVFA